MENIRKITKLIVTTINNPLNLIRLMQIISATDDLSISNKEIYPTHFGPMSQLPLPNLDRKILNKMHTARIQQVAATEQADWNKLKYRRSLSYKSRRYRFDD